MLAPRQQYPRYGKLKLHHLLRAHRSALSSSMIGRILSSRRRPNLLRKRHVIRVRKARTTRPYAMPAAYLATLNSQMS